MINNFDFVVFPERPNTSYITELKKRNGKYSGIIKLRIKAVDDLYLGSGFIRYEPNNGLIGETLNEERKLIIPGSSIKGALRQVCRAVSDSCIPQEKKKEGNRTVELSLTPNQSKRCSAKHDAFNVCITCDIFGTMGLSSKVICYDFTADAEGNTYIANVPMQYSPNISAKHYMHNKFHKGYKFYMTNCEKRLDIYGSPVRTNQRIEAVKRKTVFSGEIRFSKLHEDELALLMYSLGLAGDFSHKLGGYRSDGMGTVNFSCYEFILNGEKCEAGKAEEYAGRYIEDNMGRIQRSDECYKRIVALRNIMKYKKGGV